MDWVKSQWADFTGELKQMRPRQLMMQGVNLGARCSCWLAAESAAPALTAAATNNLQA
jgi:predicted alpha/beta-fold hydrolase